MSENEKAFWGFLSVLVFLMQYPTEVELYKTDFSLLM
jgi:hypothetical protein